MTVLPRSWGLSSPRGRKAHDSEPERQWAVVECSDQSDSERCERARLEGFPVEVTFTVGPDEKEKETALKRSEREQHREQVEPQAQGP